MKTSSSYLQINFLFTFISCLHSRSDATDKNVHINLIDFNSVKSLTIRELKKECKKHGIDTHLSKLSMVNLLCHALHISTIGPNNRTNQAPLHISVEQKAQYELLTPLYVHKLKGWTKDTKDLPMLTDTDVKHYLLKTSAISKDHERTYKLSRPYMLMPNVHSCEMLHHANFIIVRGLCNPSQSTSKDEVKYMHAILDSNGNPIGGYCVCTAGYAINTYIPDKNIVTIHTNFSWHTLTRINDFKLEIETTI